MKKKQKNSNALGECLFSFLEDDIEQTNNDVAKERMGENKISVNKADIESIMQQIITIVTEGLTIPFDNDNVSNLESVGNTISGLAQDLQDKIQKLKG